MFSAKAWRTTRLAHSAIGKRFNSWTAVESGEKGTLDYKIYIKNESGSAISTVHDIPLRSKLGDNVFNMVVEVPRWSNAKMEMSSKLPFNPIVQDSKKGEVRYVKNFFPYTGYIHNYGAFPQTWEDPSHTDKDTGFDGDGDPLDVCEIGSGVGYSGQVKQVKVLGCLALIDEGETDWKILAIDINDPLASSVNDIEDIEKHFPGLIKGTHQWFEQYKIPDGKPKNQFAFEGKPKNAEFALNIVEECNQAWGGLVTGENDHANYDSANITFTETKGFNPELAKSIIPESSKPISRKESPLDKWYFVNSQ